MVEAFEVNLDSGLGIFATVLGLVVILVGVLAVGRSSLVKAQLDALRDDRNDLVERVNRIENEKAELEVKLKEEIASRMALEKVVTGQETLNKIVELLERNSARLQHMEIRMILLAEKSGVKYDPSQADEPPPGARPHPSPTVFN